ncbi:MAG: PAS domain S-box protein [Chloroflexota bacterium]
MTQEMNVASRDLQLINAINQAANTGATLEQIVRILADGARQLFSSYGATVYLLSQDGSSLHMQNLRLSPWIRQKIEGLIGHRIGSVDIPLTEGSVYRRLLCGRPHVLDDPDEIRRMAEECAPTDALKALVPRILKLEHIASVMEVPLVAEDARVGLLEVSGKRRFTQAEVDRLAVLGEQLALVLTRKRLEEATRDEWARLREFFEHLPLLAFFIGPDGRILDCNQKAVAALGYASGGDLLGRDWVCALHPPAGQDKARQQIEKWKERGHVEGERSRLVTRTGELVDVLTMFNTVQSVRGGPTQGVVTQLDITAWERTRRDLSLSEARYQSLVETTGVGVAAADVDGDFTFVNRAFCRMIGYTREELLGQPFPVFLYSQDRNRVLGVFRRALAGRVIRADLEFRITHRDGHLVHMYSSPTALRDNGRIVGFNAIITDITELKHKEEELQAHLEESKAISDTAIALSRAGSADEVCRILGERVHGFNPDAVVVVTLADMDSRLIRPRAVFGVGDAGHMITRVLGQDPMGMEFRPGEITEEGWRLFTTGRLERVPEGVYDLLARRVPGAACHALKEALGVEAVYGAGFGLEGVPSGGVLILTTHDRNVRHGFAVETLVSQAAVVIRQREAEAALRRSEEQFAAFMDHLPAGAYIKDADSRALYVNRYMREVMGADTGWIGRSVAGLLPDPVARKMIADDRRALEQGSLVTEETVPDKNGVERVYETHKFSIVGMADKQFLGGLSIDITQRKQAEEALLKSEQEFRALFERMKDAVFLVLPEGTILRSNEAGSQLVGYEPDQIRGMHVSQLYADPRDRAHLLDKLERDGYLTDYHLRVKRRDGRVMDCLVQISQLFDSEGNSTGRIVALRDVTHEKRMQEELRDSHRRLRELAAHLQGAREQERAAIARELHDDLGQLLTALKMDLASLQREFSGRGIDIGSKTSAMSELVGQALAVSKRLSAELRPGVLDDLGLAAALEWQTQQFEERTGVRCRVVVQDLSLEPGCATALFRICQEALTNVARHAQATLVEVRLTAGGRSVVLRVTDNGRGIDQRQLSDPQAFGLMGMHERVRPYGGRVRIVGKPGKGTTVTAVLPRSARQG